MTVGDQIHVSTRDAHSAEGVAFYARLATEEIELLRVARKRGTTIRVRLSEETAEYLLRKSERWNWYRLADPSLKRCDKITGSDFLEAELLPSLDESPPPPWRHIATTAFPAIQWTYKKAPFLSCNGIVIIESNHGAVQWLDDYQEEAVLVPNVSVSDPDASLGLNLTRDQLLTASFPFARELLDDVIRDLIAFCLVAAPKAPLLSGGLLQDYAITYPGWTRRRAFTGPIPQSMWLSCSEGATLMYPWHLARARVRFCHCFVFRDDTVPAIPLHEGCAAFALLAKSHEDDGAKLARLAMGESADINCIIGIGDQYYGRARLLLRERIATHVRHLVASGRRNVMPTVDIERPVACGEIWSRGYRPGASSQPLSAIASTAAFADGRIQLVGEWDLYSASEDDVGHTAIGDMWKSYLGDEAIIPYDVEERRRKYASAFEGLHAYVRRWEQLFALDR